MTEKLNISLAVISHNEEKNIGRMLQSAVPLVSEIVVVDSFSEDKTREIAESFGAKVLPTEWQGFIRHKNLALENCNCDWILSLDCDEVVSPELAESIRKAVLENKASAFLLNRKTHYLGKLLKFAWQPDWNLRLVKKDSNPKWGGIGHDKLFADAPAEKLDGILIHYSYKNLSHHIEKTVYYAKMTADAYFEKGRKFSFFKLLFNPFLSFVKLYIIRGGFLDGFRGLIAGFSAYIYTFLKYLYLWENQRNKNG